MGWGLSSIIINPKTETDYLVLLDQLGFKNLTRIEDEPYEIAMYPHNDKVYIGSYKNNIIICVDTLPISFFDKAISDIETKLIACFPNSEICAVSLNSTINHFGFALIKNGKKIRVKAGDADLGTIIDSGEPLEQELELLSKSKIDDNGQRLYYLHDHFDEPYLENQVGENFVFEIFSRYTGISLDADDDLLETKFAGYQFVGETFSLDKYFSGEWKGQFSYGEGYRDHTKGKNQEFTLHLSLVNGQIKGFCIDGNKVADQPAEINGFIFDHFIGFVKTYPVHYFLDRKGVTHKEESSESYDVIYSGLYDSITDSFKGIWRIANKKFWGEWIMNRGNLKTR